MTKVNRDNDRKLGFGEIQNFVTFFFFLLHATVDKFQSEFVFLKKIGSRDRRIVEEMGKKFFECMSLCRYLKS